MSISSNSVKCTARNILKGNFTKAIFSTMPVLFCFIINYYISAIINIFADNIYAKIFNFYFSLFLIFPLFMGVLRFYWRLANGIADNPISVFYYFSNVRLYLKTFKLLGCVTLKLLPVALLISLPAICFWLLSQTYLFEYFGFSIPIWSRNLAYAILFTKTLCAAIIIVFSLRYYLAPILFVANDDIDVLESVHMSIVISKRSYIDFIFLIFSFFGWFFISVFTLPLVFTVPYMLVAYVVHSQFSINEYNNHIASLKESQFPSFTVEV